jgi:hypothetical protein
MAHKHKDETSKMVKPNLNPELVKRAQAERKRAAKEGDRKK